MTKRTLRKIVEDLENSVRYQREIGHDYREGLIALDDLEALLRYMRAALDSSTSRRASR